MTLFFIVSIYIIGGIFIERMLEHTHKPFPMIHETGIALLLGIACACIAFFVDPQMPLFNELFFFNKNFFLMILIPPIMLATGYNMRRKKFFENI